MYIESSIVYTSSAADSEHGLNDAYGLQQTKKKNKQNKYQLCETEILKQYKVQFSKLDRIEWETDHIPHFIYYTRFIRHV